MKSVNSFAALVTTGVIAVTALSSGATAKADAVADLVNVTVRPGYSFVNTDDAPDGQIPGEIGIGFNDYDEFQMSYLTTRPVNELCPALIWLLRNSAARYRPTGAP